MPNPGITADADGNLVSAPQPEIPAAPIQIAPTPAAAAATMPDSALAPAVATGAQAVPQAAPQKVSLPGDGMSPSGPAQVPQAASGMNQAYDLALQGQAIETRAGMQEAQRASGFYQQAQKKQQELEDARVVRQAEQKKIYDEQFAKLAQAESELSKESINSDRFWANKSTGEKIGLSFAILLSGAASGALGRENGALKIVEQAIARDIEEQKANLARKDKAVQGQKGLLAEMRTRFQDDQVAEAATRLAYANRLDLQLKENLARYQSPKVQAAGMKIAATVEGERQRLQMQFGQALQVQQARARLGIGTDQDSQDLAALTEDERARYFKDREQGIAGVASTKEGAKEVRTMASETKTQVGMLNDLIRLGKTEGRQLMPSEVSAQAEVLKGVLTGQLRTAIVGPGAMTEGDMKLLDRIIVNPTKIAQMNAIPALEKLKLLLQKRLINSAEAQGYKVSKFDAKKPVR